LFVAGKLAGEKASEADRGHRVYTVPAVARLGPALV
jgi:hypothetical protein